MFITHILSGKFLWWIKTQVEEDEEEENERVFLPEERTNKFNALDTRIVPSYYRLSTFHVRMGKSSFLLDK